MFRTRERAYFALNQGFVLSFDVFDPGGFDPCIRNQYSREQPDPTLEQQPRAELDLDPPQYFDLKKIDLRYFILYFTFV